MKTVLILGATSDIAQAIARKFAQEQYHLQLAARHPDRLENLASDLRIRHGVEVQTLYFDAIQYDNHYDFYQSLSPSPSVAITVFGYLGNQTKGQQAWEEASKIIQTNYTGAVSILNIVAENFAARRAGTIVGVSSVAGDRGRGSNYLYGSAKAGLSQYLSGLRNRMATVGVSVITVKPGFVATSMTESLDLPRLLTAQPDTVANDIVSAVRRKKDVVYSRWFWRWIMLIIQAIPEKLFKQMKL